MQTIGVSIHNRFDFRLVDGVTGAVKQEAKAFNVVTNAFYDSVSLEVPRRINYIQVGTSAVEPEVTDTSLGTFLAEVTCTNIELLYPEDPDINAAKYDFVFTEDQANGNIKEVGLSYEYHSISSYRLFTHALLTDAEGRPFTLTKTNTDKLYISAVIYSKIRMTGDFQLLRQTSATSDEVPNRIPILPNRSIAYPYGRYSPFVIATLGGQMRTSWRARYLAVSNPLCITADPLCFETNSKDLVSVESGKRLSTNRILAAEQNPGKTTLIKSILLDSDYAYTFKGSLSSTSSFYLTLPNHNIYPPKLLTFELAGDGSTTDFNLGFPELMSDGLKVTVDGVELASDMYSWGGRDYSCAQAWKSQDTKYLHESSELYTAYYSYSSSKVPFAQSTMSSSYVFSIGTKNGIVWDFQEPYDVTVWKNTPVSSSYTSDPDQTNCVLLQRSDDLETWITVDTYRGSQPTSKYNPIGNWNREIPRTTSRYWRILPNFLTRDWFRLASDHWDDPSRINTWFLCCLGDPKPQISFNTPPAAGANIKIEAYCEYPVKNDKWLLDSLVVDFHVERDDT